MENSTYASIIQQVTSMLIDQSAAIKTDDYTSSTSIPTFEVTEIRFSWYDYLIFCLLLLISLSTSVYFGCFGNKQTAKEYLLAGGNLKVLPVVISLIASLYHALGILTSRNLSFYWIGRGVGSLLDTSRLVSGGVIVVSCGNFTGALAHTSGVTLLALPAEVYSFGGGYWLSAISMCITAVFTIFVYLPVFYKLQLTSTYEYLGIRFDKRTRKLASIMFTLSVFAIVPIITYIPCLAFSSATGFDIHIVTPIVCGVCIFYTAIGGLKALVWSDTLQFSLTVGALLAILGLGLSKVGGISTVMKKAYESDRLDLFDFQLDFTKRDSFWTIVIGFTMHWLSNTAINQGCSQKFLAVRTIKDSKMVVFLYCCFGLVIVKSISVITGLTMYAKYAECDPLTSRQVRHSNEMLPHFVLDVAGKVPGLSGLFIAGVFCASLSSLSSYLNSLAGTLYEDFIKSKLSPKYKKNPTMILKLLVVIVGIIGTVLVYGVEHLGGLLSVGIGAPGIALGPLLGVFTLGMLFPRANSQGAFYGSLVSILFVTTLFVGSNVLKARHVIQAVYKPTSISGCLPNITAIFSNSSSTSTTYSTPSGLEIFKISFYWYSFIGAGICICLGLIISYLSKEQKPPVARELLSPSIYGFIDMDKYVNRMDLDSESVNIVETPEGKLLERRMSKWEENRQDRLRKASCISDQLEC